jgi:hypothetical protein
MSTCLLETNELQTHRRGIGDRLTPLRRTLFQSGEEVDLGSKTVKVLGEEDGGTSWITEGTTGVTAEPTATVTADASTDVLAATDHGYQNGTCLKFTTTGTLPGGLATSTRYYVRDRTQHTFKVSATRGGAPIDLTSAGSGTHSAAPVGQVAYAFQTADVDTAGTFWLWFKVFSGSVYDTFPVDGRKLKVLITDPTA